jgi:cytochrome c oxidase subunit II
MLEYLAQYMPLNASAHGGELDRLLAMVHWLMLILFVGWGLFFVYALYRFRASRSPKANYKGVKSHFSTYAEAGVVAFEIVLLVGFSIPAWSRWVSPPSPSANPLQLRVVAEQFAWNIHYPGADGRFGKTDLKLVSGTNPLGLDLSDAAAQDDITTVNQLHLEAGRPVTIRLSSKDVIHSFALPTMRVKQDAIPGMEIPVHFTPVRSNDGDRWEIACAQLCGNSHYRMRGELHVHPKADFQAWLVQNAPATEPAPATAPAVPPAPSGGQTLPPEAPMPPLDLTGGGQTEDHAQH